MLFEGVYLVKEIAKKTTRGGMFNTLEMFFSSILNLIVLLVILQFLIPTQMALWRLVSVSFLAVSPSLFVSTSSVADSAAGKTFFG